MQVTIEHDGKTELVEVSPGSSVLEVLQAAGVTIHAACGGLGVCGQCNVFIADAQGTRVALACREQVSDGMYVRIDTPREMAIVLEGGRVGDSYPRDPDGEGYGLAVDIGTTTIAAHLHDLSTGLRVASASCMNPQAAFGADVISRISASIDGKLPQMNALVVGAIQQLRDQLLTECVRSADSEPQAGDAGGEAPECTRFSVAGNTVMQHIAANLPPDSIGVNPFTPLSLFGDMRQMEGVGDVYFAPCVAGYVGGDIVAGLLARGMDEGPARLFIDLGTNGEMAFAAEGRITACATAAGPVFEGANITFGMPASAGAISHISIEAPGKLALTVLGDCAPIGLCGTGIVDAVAVLLDAGVVDESGFLCDADDVPEAWEPFIAEMPGGNVFYLTDDHSVYVSQRDVRNVQLAKAAVCGGVRTLLYERDWRVEDIEAVEVAGGFGQYLDVQSAARIGLFPYELASRAVAVGNTSAEGAVMMMLSSQEREHANRLVDICDYVELSTSSVFNEFFVEEMDFLEDVSIFDDE